MDMGDCLYQQNGTETETIENCPLQAAKDQQSCVFPSCEDVVFVLSDLVFFRTVVGVPVRD